MCFVPWDMAWVLFSQVYLLVCLLELSGELVYLRQCVKDRSILTGVREYRDLTISASRCINKQAFYIGNGVMNIISEFSSAPF